MNSLSNLLGTIAIASLTSVTFMCANSAWPQTEPLNKPIPWQQLTPKLHPSRNRPDLMARSAADQTRMKAAQQAGTLQTLPYWQGSFSIEGKDYHYTILGGDPTLGGTTTIPAVIVPIRLTISDFSEDGKTPVVLDATPIVKDILNSPIFAKSDYITGNAQQFTDAMLRAEFPQAVANWHTHLFAHRLLNHRHRSCQRRCQGLSIKIRKAAGCSSRPRDR